MFSVVLLVGVYIHRWYALTHKKVEEKKEEVKEVEPEVVAASKDDQEKAEAAYKRGEAMLKSGKDEEAIKCFVQALALDPLHQATQHSLAMLYLQKQMFTAAAALFRQMGEATQDPVHFSHLGLALYQSGELEEALEAYQTAVGLDDSRPQRFVSLAHVYRELGLLSNAVVAMNKAAELDKENLEFLFMLVELHQEMKNLSDAAYILKKVLELDEENKEAKKALKAIEKERAQEKS